MRHQALSREELQNTSYAPLEDGTYDFVVESAIDKISQVGNEMIELKLKVKDRYTIYDHLIAIEKMEWKTYKFCQCIGKEELYDDNEISPLKIVGAKGKAKIKKDGKYFKVEEYLWEEDENQTYGKESNLNQIDDDMPF